MEVSLGPRHIVLDRDAAPQISAHVYCGQMAEWIKMPLGSEVDLGPCHIALDVDPAPHPKGHSSTPLFGPCLLWPNGRPSQLLLNSLENG